MAPQHGIGRSVGDGAAACIEGDHPIGDRHGGIEVVLDEDDRAVARGRHLGQRRINLLNARRVEIGGGFVEHQQRRPHRQCARDRESLAATARQTVGVVRPPIPQTDAAQGVFGSSENLLDRQAQVLRPEGDLVEQGAGDQLGVGVLKDHAHAGAQSGDGGRPGIQPVDAHPAGDRGGDRVGDEAVERQGEGRLARTAGSEQEHDFAAPHLEGRAVGGRRALAVVGDGDVPHLDERGAAAVAAGAGRCPPGHRLVSVPHPTNLAHPNFAAVCRVGDAVRRGRGRRRRGADLARRPTRPPSTPPETAPTGRGRRSAPTGRAWTDRPRRRRPPRRSRR